DETGISVGDRTYDVAAYDRILVVGGGKAAGVAAARLEALLGDRIDGGVVVTDAPAGTTHVEEVVGSHPIPDDAAQAGTRRLLSLVGDADTDTLVVVVLTGGGSALLPAPAADLTLEDLQTVTDALVTSGAGIHAVNAVRKHLSRLKGGQLARVAAPATVVGLVFSDVVGNDPSVVASGPLSPDATTYADARDVLADWDIPVPPRVADHLKAGVAGEVPETPVSEDACFRSVTVSVLADGHTAINAARERARDRGVDALVVSGSISGEATTVGGFHAAIAHEALTRGDPIEPPAVLLSGGETTVAVDANGGEGGPNQECVLGGALEFVDWDPIGEVAFASVDTDGIDGTSTAAGAIVDAATITHPSDARAALRDHDVAPYLAAANAHITTGVTGTTVNDLRVLVVGNPGDSP
ncbi:MAG: glycerate kinase, partial [Halobacteriaceae archaeon]